MTCGIIEGVRRRDDLITLIKVCYGIRFSSLTLSSSLSFISSVARVALLQEQLQSSAPLTKVEALERWARDCTRGDERERKKEREGEQGRERIQASILLHNQHFSLSFFPLFFTSASPFFMSSSNFFSL